MAAKKKPMKESKHEEAMDKKMGVMHEKMRERMEKPTKSGTKKR